jgi:hypothetical protein
VCAENLSEMQAAIRQDEGQCFGLPFQMPWPSSSSTCSRNEREASLWDTPWGETRWAWELDGAGYTNRFYTSQLRQTAGYVGSPYDYNARSREHN